MTWKRSQVGSILGHLLNKALDKGNEVGVPDQQIKKITGKADVNKDCIDFANARAKKLIGS